MKTYEMASGPAKDKIEIDDKAMEKGAISTRLAHRSLDFYKPKPRKGGTNRGFARGKGMLSSGLRLPLLRMLRP